MDAEENEDAGGDVEGDLGDDVFEKGVAGEVDSGRDAWVLEGREATYPEVSFSTSELDRRLTVAAETILQPLTRTQPRTRRRETKIYHCPTTSRKRGNEKDGVCKLDGYLSTYAQTTGTRLAIPVL